MPDGHLDIFSKWLPETLALQINRMQQMQDWMLLQKEREVQMLRQELAEAQQKLHAIQLEHALLQEKMNDNFSQFASKDNSIFEIEYPVIRYPRTVKSHNLDKEHCLEGKLEGIKGQYLLFEGGVVINLRKYGGYFVEMEIEN